MFTSYVELPEGTYIIVYQCISRYDEVHTGVVWFNFLLCQVFQRLNFHHAPSISRAYDGSLFVPVPTRRFENDKSSVHILKATAALAQKMNAACLHSNKAWWLQSLCKT